jgi:hypothetical protein
MPEDVSSRNTYMQGLKQAFEAEYADAGFSWAEVKAVLNGVFEHLHLHVINSKSDEVLDYARYEKEGVGLTAIAVGGLSLSRGLTIEGLTVSYMYRNTRMYDTLMQMGRWFGYRPGFEDLCRVHLSRDSINWYSHIALAADELTQQVKRMRRDGLSPRQFGLYVMAHPDSLLITAANKMRSGEKVRFRQNFSGRMLESYIVSTDSGVNTSNFALIEKFWREGFGDLQPADSTKGVIFSDVPVEKIEDFLIAFQAHCQFADRKADIIAYLRTLAEQHPAGDVLLISPRDDGSGPYRLNGQLRVVADLEGTAWRLNKDRVASRGDEKLGLSPEQQAAAEALAASGDNPVAPSDTHYREIRNKPLLMIHSLEPRGDPRVKGPIAAFGVSFPHGHYGTEIEVVANRSLAGKDARHCRTTLTRRRITMPDSSPWDDIAVPGSDFNVRQVAGKTGRSLLLGTRCRWRLHVHRGASGRPRSPVPEERGHGERHRHRPSWRRSRTAAPGSCS